MKKWRKHILVCFVISVIILFSFLYFRHSVDIKTNLLSDTIEEQVTKILEMSSVKYNYSNIAVYKDNKKLSGLNIPFTNKSFIIKYKGYIKAGIDLNDIIINVVDPKTIKIVSEKPFILDNVINEEDVYIYDEKDSVFNKLSFNNLYDVLKEEKKDMEKEAIENGLLNDAEKNIREMLTTVLESMKFEDIQIMFE